MTEVLYIGTTQVSMKLMTSQYQKAYRNYEVSLDNEFIARIFFEVLDEPERIYRECLFGPKRFGAVENLISDDDASNANVG